jgi:hypothetical protein
MKIAATALLPVLVLGACAGPQNAASTPAPSPTPSYPAPALIQVENDPQSHPQSGLQKADIVYEYLTEGNITRFTLIYFDPRGPDRIEPVRSARLVTIRLQKAYQGVVFYSGASGVVQGMMSDQHVPGFNENTPGLFSRDPARRAPHNLMTTQDQVRALIDKNHLRVYYRPPASGEPPATGDPANSVSFQQTATHHVAYTYSAAGQGYAYSYEGGPLTDAAGGKQVTAATVVLIRVAHHDAGYTEDVLGANGIDFDLQGTGPADVYTRGRHLTATWDITSGPLRLLDSGGRPLTLPDGLTWIHLVDPAMPVQAS